MKSRSLLYYIIDQDDGSRISRFAICCERAQNSDALKQKKELKTDVVLRVYSVVPTAFKKRGAPGCLSSRMRRSAAMGRTTAVHFNTGILITFEYC
jgi:hypothetical protein